MRKPENVFTFKRRRYKHLLAMFVPPFGLNTLKRKIKVWSFLKMKIYLRCHIRFFGIADKYLHMTVSHNFLGVRSRFRTLLYITFVIVILVFII